MNKTIRIGLVMQGGHYWMGGTEYIKNIISALASLPSDVRSTIELSLICTKEFDHSLYSAIESYLDQIYYLKPRTFQNRLRWKLLKVVFSQDDPQLEALLQAQAFDFVYPCLTQRCPSAAWIYDFQHKHLPHLFKPQQIKQRDRTFSRIAQRASKVVVSSKTAAADFQQLFPEAAHKAKILTFKSCPPATWFAADPQQIQQQYALPDKFFLVSNQFWQHKNHVVIFEALHLLQQQALYPTVVCTGQMDDTYQPDFIRSIREKIQTLGISQQVHLLGLIPRLDQIQLMRRSLAVIQPSLFEGWSTVVEDARALGKTILLSDIPVHLEQNPPGSVLFEQRSPDSLASLIAECWNQRQPGPDLDQERVARETNTQEVEAFGYQFLEIARSY